MTQHRTQWLATAGVLASVLAVGTACDRTVSKKETTTVQRDGDVVRKSDTVTQKADGTIVREKKTDVDR
jgi:hypothetical protein